MPRYFFDTRNGKVDRDVEGSELKNDSAARRHAIVYAGEVMLNDPEVLWDGQDFVVEVSDEHHLLLFTVTAFASNAPAAGTTR